MTTKSKSVFYDLQEPVKDDFNYIGDSVEDQLRKRAADLFNDGILGLSSFEITIDPGSNNQTVKFSVGPGTAYVGSRRVEILSDDTTTYNELNPVKNLLNGECPKSTGCKDVTVSVSSGSDCVTVFLLYAKDYDENVCIIDPETYGKRYTRERSGYAIGYAVGTRDNRPVLPKQFDTGGVWANYRENSSDPAASWTVGYSYIIIADLLYTGSEWVVDRTRCQRIILREEVQPSEEVEKHQVTHHTNGISSLTETSFKYYKYAVKDLLGEGSFRTVSTPISLTYTSPITTTEIYIRIAVSNATNQDLTITIYDTDNTEIDHKTFTFTSSANTVTYSYTSTTSFTVGKVSVSSTGSNITVNYKTVNGVDTPKTHTIYRDTTDTDTYDEYLPFVIPQLDNNGINQSDCIMIRDTLTENRSFMYVNGKRITKFLFRGIELSSVQWTDNKKYFVLKNLTQTDFGGQTGTFYLVVDENGSIGFSTSLDPLKLALAILNVSYYTDNNWLPGSVGGLAIDLADNRHLVDSHKKLRLTSYPIEIVPTKDVSDQVEIQLSANTSPLTNIPLLPLKINIVRDSNDPTKSKLVFIGSAGNNILTILDNGNVGIGTTSPTNFKLQIDGNTGPNIDNTYDLGSTSYRWKSLYLGGGSLNIDQIGGTNYERLNIGYDTNNNRFQILTTTSGTGTLRPLYLTTGTNNGITIDVSGNVGIGTATPSQKLTVNGKLQIGDDSSPPIAGTIKWNGSNFLGYNGTVWLTLDAQPTSAAGWTADTGRVYLTTASDHVGIGIITYPQEKLVLSQGSNFAVEMSVPTGVTASTSSGGTLNGTYYYKISASDGIGWTILSSEVSATVNGGTTAGTINVSWSAVTGAVKYRVWRGTSSNGENSYYETTSTSIADNGSLTFTSGTPPTATTAYVNKISASGNSWILGNVGIGTSLPGNKFGITITSDDTVPALGSNGGSFALLKKVSNDPGNYGFLMGVLSSGNVFQQVQRIDGTATPYSLLLQPNGGNVGIGITSTPSERLEVNGNIKGTNLISTSLTSGSILFAGSNGLISQDNANLFWDNTNKRLGIGTTTPSQKLTVTGNIGLQAGANAFIGTLDNYTLSLRTNNTDRVFITSTGNVGIGTTTPSYPLHVVSGGTAAVCVTNVNTSASSYGIVSTTCYGWGVWGESSSGTGVYGVGDPQGVAGVGYNAGSRGVVGVSYTASSCGVVGVVFEVSSCGVVGVSCAANSCGVVGWGGNCAYDFYAAGPGTNYGPFTGAHDTIYSQGEFQPGDVVVVKEVRFKRCDGVSSIVPEISQTTIPCDKRVMGVYNVYLGCENCDHWVYKEGYTTQKFNWATVNSLGEGLVKVKENELGNIEIGDLLTTSDVPGFAMKQGDDIVHNYTLGKAAENIDWSTIQVDPEKGFKWTMVAVFYYAG